MQGRFALDAHQGTRRHDFGFVHGVARRRHDKVVQSEKRGKSGMGFVDRSVPVGVEADRHRCVVRAPQHGFFVAESDGISAVAQIDFQIPRAVHADRRVRQVRTRHGVAQPVLHLFAHFGNAAGGKAQFADQTDAERLAAAVAGQDDFDVAAGQRDVLPVRVDKGARPRHFVDGLGIGGAAVVNGVQLFRQLESQLVQLGLHILQFGVAQGNQTAQLARRYFFGDVEFSGVNARDSAGRVGDQRSRGRRGDVRHDDAVLVQQRFAAAGQNDGFARRPFIALNVHDFGQTRDQRVALVFVVVGGLSVQSRRADDVVVQFVQLLQNVADFVAQGRYFLIDFQTQGLDLVAHFLHLRQSRVDGVDRRRLRVQLVGVDAQTFERGLHGGDAVGDGVFGRRLPHFRLYQIQIVSAHALLLQNARFRAVVGDQLRVDLTQVAVADRSGQLPVVQNQRFLRIDFSGIPFGIDVGHVFADDVDRALRRADSVQCRVDCAGKSHGRVLSFLITKPD